MSTPVQNESVPAAMVRAVGLWGAVWLGLGSIVGTGVFVSLGVAAGVVGSGVVIAVMLAALLATANGLSSAQLAAAHPVSGGTYEYGHKFVHPLVGFLAGWMFLVAKSASAATAALGCSGYLLHTLGVTDGQPERVGLALAIVLVLTVIVAGGVRRSNRANIGIVLTTLAALAMFVLGGWLTIDAAAAAANLSDVFHAATTTPTALFEATALMFVAYTGYGRIATLGEEVVEPARTIPRAIVLTLVISMLLYVAVATTAVAVAGAGAFADATVQSAAPLEVLAGTFSYPQIAMVVAVGAITAMAGVLLNLLLGLSRVLLAMARRREMPGGLADIDVRSGSPKRAVWAVAGVIAILVLLGDVKTTWSFSAFAVLIYYGITNLAALRLPVAARRFPRWIAAAGLVSCLCLAFFVDPTVMLAGFAVIAGGLAWRLVMTRSGRT